MTNDTWRALALAALITLLLTAGLLKFGGMGDYRNIEEKIHFMELEQQQMLIEQDILKGQVEITRRQVEQLTPLLKQKELKRAELEHLKDMLAEWAF